jgi:hypothetical protein
LTASGRALRAGGGLPFVATYGQGCPGSAGVSPIDANVLPHLGNASFAVTVSQALPNAITVFAASLGSTTITIGGCDLLIDIPIVIWGNPVTDAFGFATNTLPIPNDPSWLGDNLYCQCGVVDPIGTVLGLLVPIDGLQVQVV